MKDDLLSELGKLDLLTELNKLKQKKEKIKGKLEDVNVKIKEVKTKIQGFCDHNWEHHYTDDHDGYSRVTYTQTKTSMCKYCGKVEVTKRDYDY